MAPLTQFPEETKYWKMTRKPGSQRGLFAEMWNVGESPGRWLLGVRIQVKREKEKFVAICLRPP